MRRLPSVLLVLLLCAAAVPFTSASAQDSGATIYLELQDRSTGDSLIDSCFELENASNEGCDENGDGRIRFRDIAPGTYTVRQTRRSAGFLPIGDFTITVSSKEREQSFLVATFPDTSLASTVDMRLAVVDVTTGEALVGGCFVFEGGSNEGCDENGDGIITFDDMPVGAYHLVSTATPDGYQPALDRWTGVTRSETFTIEFVPANGAADPAISDIALITRDPDSADLLDGGCYVLIDYSNEGCDENRDGRVTFDDVPAGTYEVEQTLAPANRDPIGNFTIEVVADAPEQGIVVRQADPQTDDGHRHVSILYQDPVTGELFRDQDTCVTLVNDDYKSAKACDENSDGQVDFLDVPLGTYDVDLHVAGRPAGSELVYGPMTIDVAATEASAIVIVSTLRIS